MFFSEDNACCCYWLTMNSTGDLDLESIYSDKMLITVDYLCSLFMLRMFYVYCLSMMSTVKDFIQNFE